VTPGQKTDNFYTIPCLFTEVLAEQIREWITLLYRLVESRVFSDPTYFARCWRRRCAHFDWDYISNLWYWDLFR